MAEQEIKRDFKKWLEYLQQESWQLELIISSILLFVLSGAGDYLSKWSMEVLMHSGEPIIAFYQLIPLLLISAVGIAKVNLIIHIFLRGFWIGCIGLRYVSDNIDIDSLEYRAVFSDYLKKQNFDFDKYIEQLEKVCSIIFSFTFLIIFGVFSIFTFLSSILLIGTLGDFFDSEIVKYLRRIFIGVMLLAAFLNLLDLLFIGWFRKKKYVAKIFYPFFRIFHLFTFSWIYRPLFYNFIDNPFGRAYIRLVIPYILVLILFSSGFGLGSYPFLPDKSYNSQWILPGFYDDLRDEFGDDEITTLEITIPSREIKENFLPVFLQYNNTKNMHAALSALCPDFKTFERNSIRLLSIESFMLGVNSYKTGALGETNPAADSALLCLSAAFDLKIDSIEYPNPTYHFYKHPQIKSIGILTYLNIESLEQGNHDLILKKKIDFKENKFIEKKISIPFVKFN